MKTANWIKLEIPSDTRNVAFARTAVALFASQLDWTLDELEDIKVAVSEAVSNSVIHGYSLQEGVVIVEARYEGPELSISIEDFGQGIADIEQAQEVGFTSIPEERMGLGFTFMHEYMDQVLVASEVGKGTKVTMVKRVKDVES
ncbi:MAG: anti-sigma F factor [Bacillota bacterium]|jgi:stage II sporulation protein AB (anti-sigma F factor)|nr:anti-sigma F factor [Bacillota bacterium]NLJ03914.1 anti-sigma F factor [Bacillota bacterium]